ncbi:aromatic acid exporter family protein [Mesobacillus maritimus]|uniref:FUSC family protein n=1 Tax=Mesobacillus maritimus TaxID=1643336 RepID=UPI002040C720|nr:aromatic acid exporter family protein [Mesobacillus maritimus]MCM3668394.1 aromatic acid exporter family protein [Mesobacillus maritimus]
MSFFKKFRFVGGRIVKTGIAVFVTALICHFLNWPAMFAVITAIVTIEPTAADSIKKAFVRFPASAIGAGYSVLATFLIGDSPISYTFVALATIITCNKLKLHDGILVATLTGVAMISTVHDEYVSSFFIRLGTTVTGLVVSSLVNLFVMPPKYSDTISRRIHTLFMKAGEILTNRGKELCCSQSTDKDLHKSFHQLVKEIEYTETLCTYQKDEWKYHRVRKSDVQSFHYEYKKLNLLRQVTFHIGNLIYLPSHHYRMGQSKTELIMETIHLIRGIFYNPNFIISNEYNSKIKEITEWFADQNSFIESTEMQEKSNFSPETIILYELLSIQELTEELSHIHLLESNRNNRLGNIQIQSPQKQITKNQSSTKARTDD